MRASPGTAGLTAADRRDLERIGSGSDETAYYADWPSANWDNLKRLEKRGLAATVNQSDWWTTDAGRAALSALPARDEGGERG